MTSSPATSGQPGAVNRHHLEQSPHFFLVAQPPPRRGNAFRIPRILGRQGHCSRGDAKRLEPGALAGDSAGLRTAATRGLGQRSKIDMGSQILLAGMIEHIGEAWPRTACSVSPCSPPA